MNNPTTQNGISQETLKESIRNIFKYIGENPDRLGLQGTPDRIARMFDEIFRGYKEEEKPHITVFQNGADGLVYDGMIVDSGTFYSCCEHHMMPFFGTYWFAYLPNPDGKILGISKVGRVIDYCSARLQVQERLTRDVVQMLTEALGEENPPLGMALVMKGTHLCKTMRGARKEGMMTSSYLTGRFKSNAALRSEFLKMVDR
ncbi:MAG: GTP cyclohydrolase I [Prevotella sp.]|nr:GTP cyclohydrolase I [Prevotella sp.]